MSIRRSYCHTTGSFCKRKEELVNQLTNVSAEIKKLNSQNARLDKDMLKALKQMEKESEL